MGLGGYVQISFEQQVIPKVGRQNLARVQILNVAKLGVC